MKWFAAYVRSRHESRVAQHLAGREVELFLPQYTSKRRWSDRKINLPMPLFPGYLFVRISINERMRVLTAPGVIMLVGHCGEPQPLEDAEIEQLKMAVTNGDPQPHEFIKIGERVIVTRGPMQGYEGFLLRDKGNRVVLSMNLIKQSMSVEVDVESIVPAGRG